MLSYRHAFHAGNHADVLKHTILVFCLEYMNRKDTPWLYIDTHSGAPSYSLLGSYAAMTGESEAGIARLRAFARDDPPPPAVADYLRAVEAYGRAWGDEYPGSPSIAAEVLREEDRAVFFELHPTDYAPLERRFEPFRRVRTRMEDGFSGLKSVLPPPSRRALVLIDPPYELKEDYGRVVDSLKSALARFATGVYLVWYPVLDRSEARDLPSALMDLAQGEAYRAELRVRTLEDGERGMAGSGLVVMNPPWKLAEAIDETLPYLARALGNGREAGWNSERVDGRNRNAPPRVQA
ncbi:MAG: hypothetical protein A2Z99_12970 [Treponema sp. GWB1_62_6]|nr:MAG: hypothetical protein A2Z99_12970 [Treponema sp. GWB1_62_6]